MAEYVILAGFIVIGLAAVFGAFPAALAKFTWQVLKVISLPIL